MGKRKGGLFRPNGGRNRRGGTEERQRFLDRFGEAPSERDGYQKPREDKFHVEKENRLGEVD